MGRPRNGPTQNLLSLKVVKGEIFMIGEHVNVGTEEHRAELFKSCDYGQHFFLSCGIILLSTIKLLAVIGNWAAFLHDASADLIVGRIGGDVEPLVMVRIGA